jgi:hypothetical protein
MLALGALNSMDETLLWDANCSNIQATPYLLLNTDIQQLTTVPYLDPAETVLSFTTYLLKICFNIFSPFMFWAQFSHEIFSGTQSGASLHIQAISVASYFQNVILQPGVEYVWFQPSAIV